MTDAGATPHGRPADIDPRLPATHGRPADVEPRIDPSARAAAAAAAGAVEVDPHARPAAFVAAHRHADAPAATGPLRYEGLITRCIAMALDAAVINVVAILTGVGVGLVLSVLSVGDEVNAAVFALGGLAFFIWTVSYFVVFWSTTGETPGNRVMGIRVCRPDGRVIGPKRALIRMGGLVLAVLPFFAGLLPILVDDRRRGLQDMIARTVVVETDEEPAAQTSGGHAP